MSMNWLKLVYDKKVPMGEAVLDVVIGFVLVLAVLILLIAIFWVFGRVMVKLNDRSKEKASAQPAAAPRVSAPKAPSAARPAAPVADDGISDEVVAVIAAAVAAMAPAGTTYAVRRIRREQSGRPVWAAAGVMENTRPF